MITIVLFLILLIYSVSVGLLIFGFTKVNTIDYIGLKPKTAFTIIVPFRDEAENLPILHTDWIVTTDADCTFHENWLLTLDNYIQIHPVSMLAGAVTYACENSFLQAQVGGAGQFADAAQRADQLRRLDREQDGLGVGRGRELADRLGIFLRDEVVERLAARGGDRVRHHLRSPWLRPRPRARAPRRRGRRLRGGPRPAGSALLLALGAQDGGAHALGLEDLTARFSRSAFIWRAMALVMSAAGGCP
jgi:hypothetical protein